MKEIKTLRYSEAFKKKVVQDIEAGKIGLLESARRYGIGGTATIRGWLGKLGQTTYDYKVVRVEKPGERDRIRELEREKQRLESALAQSQLKVLALEELIKEAESHYQVDIKKNSGSGGSGSSKTGR